MTAAFVFHQSDRPFARACCQWDLRRVKVRRNRRALSALLMASALLCVRRSMVLCWHSDIHLMAFQQNAINNAVKLFGCHWLFMDLAG